MFRIIERDGHRPPLLLRPSGESLLELYDMHSRFAVRFAKEHNRKKLQDILANQRALLGDWLATAAEHETAYVQFGHSRTWEIERLPETPAKHTNIAESLYEPCSLY